MIDKSRKKNILNYEVESISTNSTESKEILDSTKNENSETSSIKKVVTEFKSHSNNNKFDNIKSKSRNDRKEKVLQYFITENVYDHKPKITEYYQKVIK